MVYGWIFKLIVLVAFCGIIEAKSEKFSTAIAPYIIPDSNPIKPLLDTIFSSSRVIFNLDTLDKAGFAKTKPRKFTKLIVTRHPLLPGYIFKLYLDVQRNYKGMPDYHYWILRIQGAELVRQEITSHGLGGQFKVPQKWIYVLPGKHNPPDGYQTKFCVLVEEDMSVLSDEENEKYWASDYVTQGLLDGLYTILKSVGLHDCIKPDNIPFSTDGRVAFIDTQTFNSDVEYKKFSRYLSKPNQSYWKSIISR